jgi:CubicO group peptidase (beta-lactamase class C family)
MKLAAGFALVLLGVQAQTINPRQAHSESVVRVNQAHSESVVRVNQAHSESVVRVNLDALVAPYRENNAPGMVAILIRDGRVAWQTAFGLADLEAHRAIKPDTQFELASVTKQFTAMAIMILSEQGKLKFDDTLAKYCPEFPAYARTIRIRDLLHHVSGLPDYEELMVGKIDDNFFRSSKGPPAAHEFTSAEVLKTLSRQPKLKFAPGSRFEYSNSGYEVLGQIVERASGKRYAEFLKETIFDPVGMRDTLVLDERKHSGPRLALAYKKRNGHWEDITYSPENYEYGDGGVESTGNDLFKWDQALYTEKLVHRATRDLAFTPGRTSNGKVIETHFFAYPSAYGFGWFVSSENGGAVLEHGGDWSGYRTHIIRAPSRQVTAIVLTNSSNNDVAQIAHSMIDIAGN